ncbi:hypothetical protein [Streptomyces griseus]|uniref:hypothetical protein n=1 Tax=Streptomyces griseus TaxID=1911 RepID=UPI0036FA5F38
MDEAQEPKKVDIAVDLKGITEGLRKASAALEQMREAARSARSGGDRLVIADHPELDDLNRSLNNLYGNSFD